MNGPRLYLVRTGRTVEHLGDAVQDILVLDRPLREYQLSTARTCGLEPEVVDSLEGRAPPYFAVDDDVFFTRYALEQFVRGAEGMPGNARAVMARDATWDAVVGTQAPLELGPHWGWRLTWTGTAGGPERPVLVRMPDLKGQVLRVPIAIRPDGVAPLYRTAYGMLHVSTALHAYQANMHALAASLLERTARFRFQARTPPPAGAGNRIGLSMVHPTAVVENSVIGNGVVVGPHAVVRESVVGDGATIWDAAVVQASVIGAGAMVGHQYRVMMSVMYPQSFATSGALQFSLQGRGSAVFAAWITDVRMDGRTVGYPMDGRIVDSGMLYLGLVVGHGARVTAGVITAPGRVVPNGTDVHVDPAMVFRGIPANHPPGKPVILG